MLRLSTKRKGFDSSILPWTATSSEVNCSTGSEKVARHVIGVEEVGEVEVEVRDAIAGRALSC